MSSQNEQLTIQPYLNAVRSKSASTYLASKYNDPAKYGRADVFSNGRFTHVYKIYDSSKYGIMGSPIIKKTN